MCICGLLFETCCSWGVVTVTTCQPHSTKNFEAKLSPLYKYSNEQNDIHYSSCSTVFETFIWTADCWTLIDLLFCIFQQRQNCCKLLSFKQEENEICVIKRPSYFYIIWCSVRMATKVNVLEIEVNSKYSLTDRKDNQFYKNLSKNLNPPKFAKKRMMSYCSTYII